MRNNLYDQFSRDAQQQAFAFLISQLSIIEPQVYEIRYPEIQYPRLIPVDTSGDEWATSVTFFSMDKVGQAAWFHHMARDVPYADVTREKFERGLEMAAIGYFYTLEEVGKAQKLPGVNLTAERGAAARRAAEEFIDDAALRGDTTKNWYGLINYPGITTVALEADGAGGSPAFEAKNTTQILRDINQLLSGVYTGSLQIELANTLLLPIDVLTYLAITQIPNTTMTVMEWLKKYNVTTMQTGQELEIVGVRGLESAGVGGVGRMIAYRKAPDVLKLHIPMPHRFLPVMQVAPLRFDVPGIFRFGGIEVKRPAAFRYGDGVNEAPYE